MSLFVLGRYYVLFRLPGLKFLDSTSVKDEELAEAKRVGPYMQVIKVKEDEVRVILLIFFFSHQKLSGDLLILVFVEFITYI